MTGWRLGLCGGPAPLIAAVNKLQSQMSSCPSSISQAAAAAALTGDQDFVRESVDVYRERRDAAVAGLNAVKACSARRRRRLLRLRQLRRRHRQDDARRHPNHQRRGLHALPAGCGAVAIIQGSAYGLGPYFRISFATGLDDHPGIHSRHRQGRPGAQLTHHPHCLQLSHNVGTSMIHVKTNIERPDADVVSRLAGFPPPPSTKHRAARAP